MRLWLSRKSNISVREQLVTQVVLGILSGDLQPGQRLPSTRELARRFRVHPNTVSAAYRQMERDQWVESRRGSGVYVRVARQTSKHPDAGVTLDQLITGFFLAARRLETPLAAVRARLKQWMDMQPPDHFLLIEPEPELARIIIAELRQTLKLPVQTCAPVDCENRSIFDGAIPLALSMRTNLVRRLVPEDLEILTPKLRSAASSLAPYLPVPASALIGVVSRWAPFLKNTRTILIAAGFHPDSLLFRDATNSSWRRGLEQTSAVICDQAIAECLDGRCRVISFPLIAEASIKELMEYEEFLLSPSVS